MANLEYEKGFVDMKFAKLDIGREHRRGVPEIIYAPGKTFFQLKEIVREFKQYSEQIFISRLESQSYHKLKKLYPRLRYFKQARLGFLGTGAKEHKGYVVIVTGGTADIPVAEEAGIFLELLGDKVERVYDVGVAGIHRLYAFHDKLEKAKVIIVVAGMEAALASIISGIAKAPVIGVPTSVGYGASFKGLAALLGMLNACSLGVVTVNIDNGLGAAYFAHVINRK